MLKHVLVAWLLLPLMGFCQPQTLVIAKQREPSALSDIAEKIVTQAMKRAGIEVKFRPLPLPRAIEMANEGETDGDLLRILDVARRYDNLVPIPVALVENQLVVYGLSPDLPTMSRTQVAGLKFGYARGTFIIQKYTLGLQVTETQSIESAFNMLAEHRFDLIVSSYLDTLPSVQSLASPMYKWPRAWASEPLYLLLHKKNARLFPRIEAALQEMKKNGEMDRAYAEKLGELGASPLMRP
ncbi:ABC transporter substrate-binding protein [Pseudorhodoferax sp. Leaf274]|uniref:substrate-binding periplasmic protein n=1 Tax=Pseudorhodoferax sp. Leaf274 TaxID=1736318 RepID=UPI000703527C|nr:transporter substrate-binding domain-containing protein [Pseudorhodoferax sp. Leaf274]KQP38887.1 hypothetical protein ASF44_10615 [Pseudorhodoferax sp. Leaf274]